MGLQQDLILLGGIVLVLIGAVVATGVIDLPGTNNVQVPGGDGENNEPRYKLSTSIKVDGQITQASLRDRSFTYDTTECGAFGCGGLSFTETPLFAFGAENVEVNIELFRNGTEGQSVKVGEADKYIGNIEWTETNEITQSFSNIEEGTYAVRYTLTGQGALDFTTVKTFRVVVPETVVEGGGV